MVAKSKAHYSGDKEITVSRVFAAPRELVWRAWTEPEHLARWWGPKGFSITTHSIDYRVGGVWRFDMHGPDGRDYPNKIVFEEIVKPERLVYSHPGDDGEIVVFRSIILFSDLGGGKTGLDVRMIFPTAVERERVTREYGAMEGLDQNLDRCEQYVLGMK